VPYLGLQTQKFALLLVQVLRFVSKHTCTPLLNVKICNRLHRLTVLVSRGWTIATAFLLTAASTSLTTSTRTELCCSSDRQEHVTPLLRDRLHWLRPRERITFKLENVAIAMCCYLRSPDTKAFPT